MTKWYVLLLWFSLANDSNATQRSVGTTEISVRLLITDGFGNLVPKAMVEFRPIASMGGSRRFLDYPRESHIVLRKAKYIVNVSADGMIPYSNTLELTEPGQFVLISLLLAPINGTEPLMSRLTGRVSDSLLTTRPFVVRIFGVYSGVIETIEVANDRSFVISELPPGRYVLFLLDGGSVRSTRMIDLRWPSLHVTLDDASTTADVSEPGGL
jgi:hypothetical protein